MTKKRGNGEGTIYYNQSRKKWIGQYTDGLKSNGQPNRHSVSGDTRREVAKKLIEAQNSANKGILINNSKITLYELLCAINDEDLASNKIKEVTYKRTKDNLKIINKLNCSHLPIQKVTSELINSDLINNLKDYSNSVICKIFGLLRKGFNKAVLLNIIPSTPFNIDGLIIKPKSNNLTKEIDALTIEEQLDFVNTLNNNRNKYKTIFLIAIFTGMRIGEILALKKSDINLDKKIINIKRTLTKDKNDKIILGDSTKTYSGKRTIPIPENMFSNIETACKCTNDLLFTNLGKLISPSTINTQFKRIGLKLGIRIETKEDGTKYSDVNTHMLRHTYATRCIESGMQAVVLSKLLGHKDVEVTLNTYTTIFNKYKQEEVDHSIHYLKGLGIIDDNNSKENKKTLEETIKLLTNIYLINEPKFNEVADFIKKTNSGLQRVCNPTV